MNRTPETAASRNLLEEVNHRITSFVRTFTVVLYLAGAGAGAGLVMRYLEVTGGVFLFVFCMALLVLLFMVQIGLSFFYIIANIRLAFLGAGGSFSLMLGTLALIFRYQDWWGWAFMFFITVPVYVISSIFLGMYLAPKRALQSMQRKFLYRNLLIPFLFVLLLALLAFDTDASRRNDPFRGWSIGEPGVERMISMDNELMDNSRM
jgi:hypothetical protein